jgi:hypothetical protein
MAVPSSCFQPQHRDSDQWPFCDNFSAPTIKDIARLKALYDLFAEVLDHLCKIGSTYENDPGVVL